MKRGSKTPEAIVQAIIQRKTVSPELTLADIAAWVKGTHGLTLDKATVGRILQRRGAGASRTTYVSLNLENPNEPATFDVNRNAWGLIEVYVHGDIENTSADRSATLRRLQLSVETEKGAFVATAEGPLKGDAFAPGYLYRGMMLRFTGNAKSPDGRDWEPLISGKTAVITLDVSGQPVQTRQVKLADRGETHSR